MKLIDLTGPIYNGMWTYGEPYPPVKVTEIPAPEWVDYVTYSQHISMGVQSGTYLETSAHMSANGPKLIEIPLQKLYFNAVMIQLPDLKPEQQIEVADLEKTAPEIHPGDSVFIATGWDRKWRDSDFINNCPNFSKDAMDWILDRKPFLVGCDLPRWDSWKNPQQFFIRFFEQGVLLLAPLMNLREIKTSHVQIIALPIKVENTVAAPCRVVALLEK